MRENSLLYPNDAKCKWQNYGSRVNINLKAPIALPDPLEELEGKTVHDGPLHC
jgi:hypothetical protein